MTKVDDDTSCELSSPQDVEQKYSLVQVNYELNFKDNYMIVNLRQFNTYKLQTETVRTEIVTTVHSCYD